MSNYNQEYSDYTVLDSTSPGRSQGAVSKKFMSNVFAWMFVALGISTAFAFLFSANGELMRYMFSVTERGMKLNMLGWLVMLAPLGFALTMSIGFNRLSAQALTALFLAYAAVNGISFSFILLAYTATSVMATFATAAAMFGIMAVMGYTTDKDLTKFGSLLMMGLVGLVVATMINWFMHSEALSYLISFVGVAVFTGLTAYDVQKLKRIGAGLEFNNVSASDTRKLSLMGAFNLYLDFVNLFLMLLRLFGNRRD